jgi:CRISPR-associated protein Cmr4
VFGPEPTADPSEHAGSLAVSDLRLLLFPVASIASLFAWVTSPYLLRRYARDRRDAGIPLEALTSALAVAHVGVEEALVSDPHLLIDRRIYLDDADLQAKPQHELVALGDALARALDEVEALRPELARRLVVVSDAQLGALARQATEVVARVRLEPERKTVATGGLWYEEALPPETVLYGRVIAEPSRGKVQLSAAAQLAKLAEIRHAQLGGQAGVGRGLCRLGWDRVGPGPRAVQRGGR